MSKGSTSAAESRPPAKGWDVFISYSHASGPRQAEQLRLALTARGLSVFKDTAELRGGDRWLERLGDAVGSCKRFVVLIGPEGLTRWVGAETGVALNRHFGAHADAHRPQIVPVLMEGAADLAIPPLLGLFQCLRWASEDGVPTALLDVLAGQDSVAPQPPSLERCPYLGLAPFQREDAALFFGRERDTLAALARLGDPYPRNPEDVSAWPRGSGYLRWLSIVGGSGAGKSSLVRAGLLPLVEAGALWPRTGYAHWCIAGPMMPGDDPVKELARAIDAGVLPEPRRDSAALAQRLRSGDDSALADWLHDRTHDWPADRALLLVVDQFEELFTLAPHATRLRFDALVAAALAANGSRLHLLTTMRSDYQHRIADDLPVLGHRYNELSLPYTLAHVGEAGLRRAIEQPALLAGLDVTELTQALVDDARDDMAGALPLVEHALASLWRSRQTFGARPRLTLAAYEAAGRLAGMLGREADAVLARLAQRSIAHREGALELLLALSRHHPDRRHTRQQLPLQAARRQAGLGDEARGDEVLRALSGHRDADAVVPVGLRLITVSGERASARVDLIHEALLRSYTDPSAAPDAKPKPYWPTLVDYLELHKGRDLLRQNLRRQAEEWADAPSAWRWRHAASWFDLRRFKVLKYLTSDSERQYLKSSRLPATASVSAMALGGATLCWLFVLQPGYRLALDLLHTEAWRDFVARFTWREGISPPLPQAVEIPLGPFVYGCVQGRDVPAGRACPDDKLRREVDMRDLPQPCTAFAAHEVTFEQYDYYVWTRRQVDAANGPRYPALGVDMDRGRHPVVDVSYLEALAYAEWLSEFTGQSWRLPTEVEWEYAARAVHVSKAESRDGPYWWGDEAPPVGAKANCFGCDPARGGRSAPVGSYKPNPFGLYDTVGNVWEWTSSAYRDGDAKAGPSAPVARVRRGGSWLNVPSDARASVRLHYGADFRGGNFGFRLCRVSSVKQLPVGADGR